MMTKNTTENDNFFLENKNKLIKFNRAYKSFYRYISFSDSLDFLKVNEESTEDLVDKAIREVN
jgi:hypothetical protein